MVGDPDIAGVRRERDLYRSLLQLGSQQNIEQFLETALGLLIEIAGARRGAIKLWDRTTPENPASFSLERGLRDDDGSGAFSRSVIQETFATGETIVTASALGDPRFRAQGSVQAQRLEAVLCVPIGRSPIVGVVYLQDRIAPGSFTDADRARAEMFAEHMATFVDRLLLRRRAEQHDPTQELRRTLKVDSLVGSSPAVAELLKQVACVARTQATVLLTGASGSGKTHLARLIHDNSARAGSPFLEVSCGGIPSELIANELFGAVAGAHSTARKKLTGKFEAADGGTLFLDEIGELPSNTQATFLQVLQSRRFFPLGSSVPCEVDVRVIAATNQDLQSLIAQGRFREDLYYRVNVFPIRMPSLSERAGDIPALAAEFCRKACAANSLPLLELTAGALRAVEGERWDGEVRELAHAMEAAVIRAHGDSSRVIERNHVFPMRAEPPQEAETPATLRAATHRFQAEMVQEALDGCGGNVTLAARALGITRAHLYNLMTTFGTRRAR